MVSTPYCVKTACCEKRKRDDHNELNQVHNEGAVLHLVGIRGTLYCNHLLLSMCVWEPWTVY